MKAKTSLLARLGTMVCAAAWLGAACSAAPNQAETGRQATVQALSESILQTSTAVSMGDTGAPEVAVATAQAQATQRTEAIQVTQSARTAQDEQAAVATADALAPYQAALPIYEVDPEMGRLAWAHPPVMLDVEGYLQYDYANQFAGTVVQDFVLTSDITWNTRFGSSGCGFVLRSNGSEDAYDQYLAILTRGASGHFLFGTMTDSELVTGRDIYAYGQDPNFEWENDTTNRLTVVGRGNQFFVYTNDTFIGEIDPSAPPPQPYIPPAPFEPTDKEDEAAMEQYRQAKQEYDDVVRQINAGYAARANAFETEETVFEKGFVALVALSESGRTVCQFDNTWLWLIEE